LGKKSNNWNYVAKTGLGILIETKTRKSIYILYVVIKIVIHAIKTLK
jgi:hypothetical protein